MSVYVCVKCCSFLEHLEAGSALGFGCHHEDYALCAMHRQDGDGSSASARTRVREWRDGHRDGSDQLRGRAVGAAAVTVYTQLLGQRSDARSRLCVRAAQEDEQQR